MRSKLVKTAHPLFADVHRAQTCPAQSAVAISVSFTARYLHQLVECLAYSRKQVAGFAKCPPQYFNFMVDSSNGFVMEPR
jgi:hypothetical protein